MHAKLFHILSLFFVNHTALHGYSVLNYLFVYCLLKVYAISLYMYYLCIQADFGNKVSYFHDYIAVCLNFIVCMQ